MTTATMNKPKAARKRQATEPVEGNSPARTAQDVIGRSGWISPNRAGALLGLPERQIADAYSRHKGKYFFSHCGSGTGLQLDKSDILGWIDGEQIACNIPEVQQETPPSEPKQEAPKSLTSQVNDVRQGLADGAASEKAEMDENRYSQYVAILQRADSPQPDDAQWLAFFAEDYDLDDDQIGRDIALAKSVPILTKLHSQIASSRRAYEISADAYLEGTKRHEVEERELRQAKSQASYDSGQCDRALGELVELRRQRPDLFAAETAGLPRLRDVESDSTK